MKRVLGRQIAAPRLTLLGAALASLGIAVPVGGLIGLLAAALGLA